MTCIWSSWCHCHPVISSFIKIQNGYTFLVLAFQGCPGKEVVKWMFVLKLATFDRQGVSNPKQHQRKKYSRPNKTELQKCCSLRVRGHSQYPWIRGCPQHSAQTNQTHWKHYAYVCTSLLHLQCEWPFRLRLSDNVIQAVHSTSMFAMALVIFTCIQLLLLLLHPFNSLFPGQPG